MGDPSIKDDSQKRSKKMILRINLGDPSIKDDSLILKMNDETSETKKSEELNPILLILSISTVVFFSVFLICSYFDNSGKTLKSIKNPKNAISPVIPQIDTPVTVIPVQPSRGRH